MNKLKFIFVAVSILLAMAFTVSCSGDDGSDGKDGAAGSQGEQGAKGDTGAPGQGIKGDDGDPGNDGKDGESCKLKQYENGSLTITCGTDVAVLLCGGALHDVATKICDLRDGKQYGFAKIGDQTWLTENMNYAGETGSEKGTCYGGSSSNCNTYGRLYTWAEATAANFCPTGWKLPSKADWEEALGGEIDDLVLQKGGMTDGTTPYGIEIEGYFWSETSATNPTKAHSLKVTDGSETLVEEAKANGFSVRCLKN